MTGRHQAVCTDFFPKCLLKPKQTQNKHYQDKICHWRYIPQGAFEIWGPCLEFWAVLISRSIISVKKEIKWVHQGRTDWLSCQWPQNDPGKAWHWEYRNGCIQAALKSVSNYIHPVKAWLFTTGKWFMMGLTSLILLSDFAKFVSSSRFEVPNVERAHFQKVLFLAWQQCEIIS